MRTTVTLIGENNPNILGGIGFVRIIKHLAVIIGIADCQVTNTLRYGLDLVDIGPLRFASKIVFQSLKPGFCVFLAMMGNHRGHQCDIVNMHSRTETNAPLPFRIGKFFVCRNGVGLHTIKRRIKNTCTSCQTNPQMVLITELFGDIGIDHIALKRCCDIGINSILDAPDINRQQKIGRTVAAFMFDTFDQTALRKQRIDPDAGFLSELFEHRFNQERLAKRIYIHLLGSIRLKCRQSDHRAHNAKDLVAQ